MKEQIKDQRLKRVFKKHKSVYIDVDNTPVVRGKPNQIIIDKIKRYHSEGCYLVLWSAAGEEHAREEAEKLGIQNLFRAILTKPETVIDDKGFNWAKYITVLIPKNLIN